MAFDVKQLMVDITKAGGPQQQQFYCFQYGSFCGYPSHICWCSYFSCGYWSCAYTWGCGGTPCYGTETITIQFQQGINQETLTAVKAQLHAALKEVEEHEKKLAEEGKKSKR